MKFFENNSSLFCEEVGTATMLFEKWNDCERTVVIYAFLKRLRYPNLKFLQYSIESVLSHMTTVEIQAFEFNSNNSEYLQQLIFAYSDNDDSTNNYESNPMNLSAASSLTDVCHTKTKVQLKKENILKEILEMLPLLRPGNNEAKSIYLSLIPLAVKDTVKQTVSPELTQQMISYLLIHPAIFNDDRRSLNHWLRYLEEHIQSRINYNSCKDDKQKLNYFNCSNKFLETQKCSLSLGLTKSNQSAASLGIDNVNNVGPVLLDQSFSEASIFQQQQQQQQQLSNITQNIWQAIAPPHSHSYLTKLNGHSLSGSCKKLNSVPDISESLNDEISQMHLHSDSTSTSVSAKQSSDSLKFSLYDSTSLSSETTTTTNSQSETLIDVADTTCVSLTNGNNCSSSSNNSTNDRHISFSKNGREILDYNDENSNTCDKCNTKIVGYNSAMLCCYQQQRQQHEKQNKVLKIITAPRWSLDSKMATSLKTRRSNSLTTSTLQSTSSSTGTVNYSNSSENLPQFLTKPRSFSLTIDQPKNVLIQSGSDTRLDDLKPNYMQFQSNFVGMSNIGQWLKSLRLHKYVGIFANMTYDNMLEISEDYLQSRGVTKGASHKLSKCIEKLKERYNTMSRLEQELRSGSITVKAVVDELANIVLTPMKPVDNTPDNVAVKFFQLLDLVIILITRSELNLIQDEESVNSLLWILERSIHNEAFLAYSNQLKEHKFKLSKIRLTFVPKTSCHSTKTNCNNNGFNKSRWNNKKRKNINGSNGESVNNCVSLGNNSSVGSFSGGGQHIGQNIGASNANNNNLIHTNSNVCVGSGASASTIILNGNGDLNLKQNDGIKLNSSNKMVFEKTSNVANNYSITLT